MKRLPVPLSVSFIRTPSTRKLTGMWAVIVLATAVLAASTGCGGGGSTTTQKQVAVPSVVGQTQAAATTAIQGAGLSVGTVTRQASSTVASGTVISESPVAGTQVNPGSAVNLVVSSGPAQVAVPNVVGDTQAAATTAITGAGLVLGTVTNQASSTVAAGSVISESPAAGTQVNPGSAVNLVVSSGPGTVAVPNVVGDTQAAATTAITGAGLVVGTVTTQASSTVASGSVISESPTAGTQVSPGSAVNLVVSSGPPPLSAANVNFIFVVSGDLAYSSPGDVNAQTANLTSQGLNRSLQMASYLQQSVLGSENVTGIYVLEPMTHPQTPSSFPDLTAMETIQQFALQNQITLSSNSSGGAPLPNNSFPLNSSYAHGSTLPIGVATPALNCPACQGIDFNDEQSDDETLVDGIITANAPGFYVFAAPWETTSALLASINQSQGYNLTLPTSFAGSNMVYAISIAPSAGASLLTYNSNLSPATTYPALPSPITTSTTCSATPFNITVTGGTGGAQIPTGANKSETLYLIRHAEAHPESNWDDGNYVCAGQWRALDLPNALQSKISPQVVYSIDPAQPILGSTSSSGRTDWSYVRPALTVEPYAIANNLPYYLAASFELSGPDSQASNFFFNGGALSNESVLLAWEHAHIPTLVNALLASYYPGGGAPTVPAWGSNDYDSIWTITLDGTGNVTVNNNLCEGIVSASLPATCPAF